MAHDFRQYLKVPSAKARPLLAEVAEAEWARYGQNIHRLINSERFLTAINICSMRGKDGTADVARRLRVFLSTGVIPS